MIAPDAKSRFSVRVDDYVKYRPTYPPAILDLLKSECGFNAGSIIVDVGSGTGILTRLFLDHGNRVIGIEPNREMREAAESWLNSYEKFTSKDASAEATGLPAKSADFIVAGQAFHWFDRDRARAEWLRILKPEGWAALVWNDRRTESTAFLEEYETFVQKFGAEYSNVNHKNVEDLDLIRAFFGGEVRRAQFDNHQYLDFDSLVGRVASSSYAPARGTPGFAPMTDALADLFACHETNGRVTMEYDTAIYYGRLR